MKFTSAAILCALCISSTEGFSNKNAHSAAFVRVATKQTTPLAAVPRYGPQETENDEDENIFSHFLHGAGCPCCLSGAATLSPREARIEGPVKALLAGGVLASLSPAAPAQAAGKSFTTALNQYFPLSLSSSGMVNTVMETLSKNGFTKTNTLFGSSVCPDEINSKPSKSLATALQSTLTEQNGQFTLGGLGGIPFVGISGVQAFMSHTPDNGKVVIMYGPHVGISDDGIVGKVERLGKEKLSGSCGAGLGALKAIQAEATQVASAEEPTTVLASAPAAAGGGISIPAPVPQAANAAENPMLLAEAAAANAAPKQSVMDNQEEYIIRKLRPRLTTPTAKSISAAAAPAYVTYQMFELVEELLMEELKTFWKSPSSWDSISEVVLLGGIVVNRGQISGNVEAREDFYHPIVFESYKKPSQAGAMPEGKDLFPGTFGEKADSWFA